MPRDFVHLHLHTDYSLLDGACPISWAKLKKEDAEGKLDLVTSVKNAGMKACAITDHGVMGGCLEFHNAMKKEELKPIIGCETYVAPHSNRENDSTVPHIKGYHLILLAKDNVGYHNLCHIISDAHTHGFYYKPRTDKAFLAAHSEGLIASSACLAGELEVAALEDGYEAAKKVLYEYIDIFGKDNFYIELMYHQLEDQRKVNKILIELARNTGVPMIATNDVHYLRREDAKAHEVMLCIQTRTTMSDPRRMRMETEEFYFKNGDEMFEIFGSEVPEALTNTLEVAERCNVNIGYENHYPEYEPPAEYVATLDMDKIRQESRTAAIERIKTQQAKDGAEGEPSEEKIKYETEREVILRKTGAYLRHICLYGTGKNSVCGFLKKYGYDPFDPPEDKKADAEQKLKRLDYELSIIMRTRYPSYFLCVWDFINWAKEHGIPVGAGRGSGAGSLVAYLSGITDIDPLKYDLLFERFLNPDRVSPPDFDTDFCERRRQEVIEYVIKKYGKDSVSQIGTYGQLKAKAVLKDVARALSRTPAEGNMITKTVPEDSKITLGKAVAQSTELKALLNQEEWVREVFTYAKPLEMLNRQMGIHACGVIISNQPLANLLPLGRGAHDEVITQYTAPLCESVGLLKMDFLGLRTLTLVQDAVDNIYKSRKIKLDLDKIPLDDQATYDLLNKGDTVAVFQLESGGMQKVCRQFKVENIKHIIALLAIYRPGPMDFIPLFVGRKLGTIPVEYDHPLMEQYLKETYGIMLYQEQIMQVVQALAGFSLGQADILRRAIGKKKIKDMEAQHGKFIEGCFKTNQIPEKTAETIWENIKKFADYGFNKSHSAAYGLLSYRTAYLKANYRPEFMAAVLTSELSNAEKLRFLINECKTSGIDILPPDVNRSDVNFTVDNGAIRFGLGAIKGFGEGASETIIRARTEGGDFKSLSDLLERTGGVLNAKAVENLIRAGAMDSFGLKRAQQVAIIEPSISSANTRRHDKEVGQGNLFDMLSDFDKAGFGDVPAPDIPEFPETEILANEKDLLGFYVSGHPVAKHEAYLRTWSTMNVDEIVKGGGDVGVRVGGMIKSVARKAGKKDGRLFGIIQFEDLTGTVEVLAYSRTYDKYKDLIHLDERLREQGTPDGVPPDVTPLFVVGLTRKGDEENDPVTITAEAFLTLEQVMDQFSVELHVHLYESEDKDKLRSLLKLLRGHHGGTSRLILCMHLASGETVFMEASSRHLIKITPELLASLDSLLGSRRWRIKTDDTVPQPRPKFERPAWKKDEPGNNAPRQ
ncbi:MAG: DNA polymerase III subunit alpha [Lentisphaeria bacterium]|nr:DNA polymerase III subunit alpha [Lentisphaeria bacterium]